MPIFLVSISPRLTTRRSAVKRLNQMLMAPRTSIFCTVNVQSGACSSRSALRASAQVTCRRTSMKRPVKRRARLRDGHEPLQHEMVARAFHNISKFQQERQELVPSTRMRAKSGLNSAPDELHLAHKVASARAFSQMHTCRQAAQAYACLAHICRVATAAAASASLLLLLLLLLPRPCCCCYCWCLCPLLMQ